MVDNLSRSFPVSHDKALHRHTWVATTLNPVTLVLASPVLALAFRLEISPGISRKILKSSSSGIASKTGVIDSSPIGILSLRSSGCGNVTRGGDRAARSCLSLQGVITSGLSAAKEARFSKNILKLNPSKVAWLLVTPMAKPPHLNEVTCEYHTKTINTESCHPQELVESSKCMWVITISKFTYNNSP